jgi:hypothetical protein
MQDIGYMGLSAAAAKHAGPAVTNSSCPHITAELLVVSRMDYPLPTSVGCE